MTQRNPMNDRYREENRGGKTRKSAASAKPTAVRAATVRDPAPKTKKQKKAEAREREQKREQRYSVYVPDNKRVEDLPEYKRLRRTWWVCLGGAIGLIAISFLAVNNESFSFLYIPCIVMGYALVIVAFYIDFSKIRKLRRRYEEQVVKGKSKEARAAQKQARAEARAQRQEAELTAGETEVKSEKSGGFLARFRKKSDSQESAADSEGSGEEASGKK